MKLLKNSTTKKDKLHSFSVKTQLQAAENKTKQNRGQDLASLGNMWVELWSRTRFSWRFCITLNSHRILSFVLFSYPWFYFLSWGLGNWIAFAKCMIMQNGKYPVWNWFWKNFEVGKIFSRPPFLNVLLSSFFGSFIFPPHVTSVMLQSYLLKINISPWEKAYFQWSILQFNFIT